MLLSSKKLLNRRSENAYISIIIHIFVIEYKVFLYKVLIILVILLI